MYKKSIIVFIALLALVLGTTGCFVKKTPLPVTQSSQRTQVSGTPVPDQGTVNGIEYSINYGDYNYYKNKKIGYFVDTLDEPNSPFIVTITQGEKPSGGYSVRVVGIDVDASNTVTITVDFVSPGEGSEVTAAMTYPGCVINFRPQPSNVVVQNTAGVKLERLS